MKRLVMEFLKLLVTVFGIMTLPMFMIYIYHLQDKHHEREIEKIYQKYGLLKKDIEDINERK